MCLTYISWEVFNCTSDWAVKGYVHSDVVAVLPLVKCTKISWKVFKCTCELYFEMLSEKAGGMFHAMPHVCTIT